MMKQLTVLNGRIIKTKQSRYCLVENVLRWEVGFILKHVSDLLESELVVDVGRMDSWCLRRVNEQDPTTIVVWQDSIEQSFFLDGPLSIVPNRSLGELRDSTLPCAQRLGDGHEDGGLPASIRAENESETRIELNLLLPLKEGHVLPPGDDGTSWVGDFEAVDHGDSSVCRAYTMSLMASTQKVTFVLDSLQ